MAEVNNTDKPGKDADELNHFESHLEELKNTREKLKSGDIDIEEAKQRLQAISEISAQGEIEQEVTDTELSKKEEKKAQKEAEKTAKEMAKREAVEAKRTREAEKKAVKKAAKAAKEMAKREAEEAKLAWEAEKQALKEAEKASKELVKRETKSVDPTEPVEPAEETQAVEKTEPQEADEKPKVEETVLTRPMEDSGLFEGELELKLVSPVNLGRMRELQKNLNQVQYLTILMQSGSADKGTSITVSAASPIPLVNIIRNMPPVEQVSKTGNRLQVTLKSDSEN